MLSGPQLHPGFQVRGFDIANYTIEITYQDTSGLNGFDIKAAILLQKNTGITDFSR
jgi:hypothetical protein